MNKIIFVIIIFFACSILLFSAEGKSENKQKIDLIFQAANDQFNQAKYQQSLEKFQEALKLSLKINSGERDKNLIAVIEYDIGCCYYYLNDKKFAIKYLKDSIVLLDKYSNINNYLNAINELANVYWSIRDFKMYILLSEKMIAVYNKNNEKNGICVCYIDIANAYYSMGEYQKALNNYEIALNISNEIKNENDLMYIYNGIANVYYGYGKYDSSFDNYAESYKLSLKSKNNNFTLLNLLGQGNVYFVWGNYDLAHEFYNQAYNFLENAKDENLNYYLSTVYDKIARIYQINKNFSEAINYFNKVLDLSVKYNKPDEKTQTLNSIGAAYFEWRNFEESIRYYKQALDLAEKNKLDFEKTRIYIHIGGYYDVKKNYPDAIYYYEKALKLAKSLNYLDSIEIALGNLGKLYFKLENYDNSLKYFIKAVDINEKIRKTANEELKRDYLASQIKNYESLTEVYYCKNNASESFNSNENSRAKYLAEKLGEKIKNINFKFDGINNYRNKLNDKEAIISFANSDLPGFMEFSIDKKKIAAKYVINDQINNLELDLKQTIANNFENLRGLKIVKSDEPGADDAKKSDNNLTMIINYYRFLLSNPERTIKEGEDLKLLSQILYKLLFDNIADSIKDKKTLIIIPDGILAYLPFESLIMPDGKYLVEKYDIKYVQSLTVQELIDKRKYSAERKPLLAFGGAVYDQKQSNEKIVLNDKTDINPILEKVNEFIIRGKNLNQIYKELGYKWNNLPGTLEEVNKISESFKNSDLYTGESVNESKIKDLSDRNKLSGYKIIHFATHGLVDPQNPDLSALVLSQNDNRDDGYLTLNEITKLKLNADLVILSACETGLGKIYSGEGVVGLTQGFLLAGANALAVSLWQVADASTMEFMTGFYKIITSENLTYNEAINKMKREFLKDDKYKDPFYWACFVYYGK